MGCSVCTRGMCFEEWDIPPSSEGILHLDRNVSMCPNVVFHGLLEEGGYARMGHLGIEVGPPGCV